jgi:hypothetical protein
MSIYAMCRAWRTMNRNGNNGGAGSSSSGVRGGAPCDQQLHLEPLATGMEVDDSGPGDSNGSTSPWSCGTGGSDSSGSSSPSSCVTSNNSPSIQRHALPLLVFGCRRCLMYRVATIWDFLICVNCKRPNPFDIREKR